MNTKYCRQTVNWETFAWFNVCTFFVITKIYHESESKWTWRTLILQRSQTCWKRVNEDNIILSLMSTHPAIFQCRPQNCVWEYTSGFSTMMKMKIFFFYWHSVNIHHQSPWTITQITPLNTATPSQCTRCWVSKKGLDFYWDTLYPDVILLNHPVIIPLSWSLPAEYNYAKMHN